MSDTSETSPAVPATTTPAEPVAVSEPAADPAVAAEPVVVERKKRGVGAWSFVLGLLTALADLAVIVVAAVLVFGALASLSTGDFSGLTTALGAAGLTLVAFFVFFGGFFTGGLAALLGLIALISGRGRVLGFFGLLFGAIAIVVRLALLSSGQFAPELG
jgi:hypothetical protein